MVENDLHVEPSPRGLRQRCVLLIGSVGPLGHCPASGTVTVAVIGVPLVWLAGRYAVPLWVYLAATTVLTFAGVWIHHVGDRILGEKDSRKLVIDELVGYAIAMTAVTPTWRLLLLGLCLERAIDIVKVWPANWVEKRLPGGWGVVGDDVVAGLYALIVLHAIIALVPQYVGL